MKTFKQLVAEHAKHVTELMPWDLEAKLNQHGHSPLLLDIREPAEFAAMHIKDSINVPRGILESACDYDYYETVPELVKARDQEIIIICRSGNRSVMAASTMQEMGYSNTASLKTGLKGWNDYNQSLVNNDANIVDAEIAEEFLNPEIKPKQINPQ
ncbi:MAG: rhodanese-like domain-containing protein [Gammaproteobacteria bacterium]|nr:rhodanese-like domain-containing protein [Gammaproteobacteria bacterium]